MNITLKLLSAKIIYIYIYIYIYLTKKSQISLWLMFVCCKHHKAWIFNLWPVATFVNYVYKYKSHNNLGSYIYQ